MGAILGLGVSHFPLLGGSDEGMANILRGRLKDPDVPAEAKNPDNWPEPMRKEWGEDQGVSAARKHREDMLRGIRRVRSALDEFNPDVVIVWGDDQYENFRESIIPPFCVLAYDDMDVYPWRDAAESSQFSAKVDQWGGGRPNVWNEGLDYHLRIKGQRDIARELTTKLIEHDFDVAYAYEPLHHPGLAHAFLNAVLYLDYDRKGFPWPMIPVPINCYGRGVISYRGYISHMSEKGRTLDPPSPSPRRIYNFGAAIGRICRESPYRVALIASSGWSHAFLNEATHRLMPNVEFDRSMFAELQSGNLTAFRDVSLAKLEETGNQEMLNWCALMGAMEAIGSKCDWAEMIETYIFNSSKVSAVFAPC